MIVPILAIATIESIVPSMAKILIETFYISDSKSPVLWVNEVGSGNFLWEVWSDRLCLTRRIYCFLFAILPIRHFHSSVISCKVLVLMTVLHNILS